MTEYVKKDRKGTMWKENNSKVIWKGSIHHKRDPENENDRGVDKYYAILKTTMKDKYGNPNDKFELVQSVGLLYRKDGNAGENAPDIGGPVTVDLGNGQTVSQKFGGWVNVNEETKTQTLSCGLIDAVKKEESESYFPADNEEDDLPF
jgi:hypothetical protein